MSSYVWGMKRGNFAGQRGAGGRCGIFSHKEAKAQLREYLVIRQQRTAITVQILCLSAGSLSGPLLVSFFTITLERLGSVRGNYGAIISAHAT